MVIIQLDNFYIIVFNNFKSNVISAELYTRMNSLNHRDPYDRNNYKNENENSSDDELLHFDVPNIFSFKGFATKQNPDVHCEDCGSGVEDGSEG